MRTGDDMMQRRYSAGITMIELMVVTVIVAILAGVAYPSYRQYAIRSNRTEAKSELMQLTQTLEKCYTRVHSYEDCADDYVAPSGNYQITVDVDEDGQSYLLSAIPQGGQEDDNKKCGTLTLNEQGVRKELGDKAVDPVRKCW